MLVPWVAAICERDTKTRRGVNPCAGGLVCTEPPEERKHPGRVIDFGHLGAVCSLDRTFSEGENGIRLRTTVR